MNVKPDPRVLKEASRWHARMLADDYTADEKRTFAVWLADPVHARAYASAVTLGQLLSKSVRHPGVQALANQALMEEIPGVPAGEESLPARHALPARYRARWIVPTSLAAGLALMMVGIGAVMREPIPATPVLSSYETSASERQVFTLEDGTTINADVATRLTVRMDATAREIELHAGRALFSVAHDPARPFLVRTNATRTVALGTQFQVQYHKNAVLITLAEGSVRISGGLPDSPWEETLVPGEQIALDTPEAAPRKRVIDPNQVTSWSRGRLLFRGTPLTEAVEEINRYAPIKVRIADATLANLEVGGNFIAGDSRPIVSAFAAVLPLTIVERDGEILLLRRNDTGG